MTQGGPKACGGQCVVTVWPKRFRTLLHVCARPKIMVIWHLYSISHYLLFYQ